MKKIKVKRTKIAKIALASVILTGIFGGSCQTAKAEEKMHIEGAVDFVDAEGNVMATFIPYSEENPAPSELKRATAYQVDVKLGGHLNGYLSNIYELEHEHRIDTNISINPNASSNIGLYNRDTKIYGFPAGGLSSVGWNGYIVVNGNGKYSLAFSNNSDTEVTYKGSYSL